MNNYAFNIKKQGVSISKARLITREELEKLGCDGENITCEEAPEWVYSTTYWTATKDIYVDNRVWCVYTWMYFDGEDVTDDYSCGVRPLLEIPLSEFE